MTAHTWTQWLTAHDAASLNDLVRSIVARHGMWATWLVPAIYAGCLAAFVADLTSADTLAFGVFYVPLVATAVFHRNKNAVWILTVIACAMAALLTLSIFARMSFFLASICVSTAFTATICCSAVCLSRSACVTWRLSVFTITPLDWSISAIVDA